MATNITTGLDNVIGTTSTTSTQTSSSKALGKDEFMKLLLAQLKNQDPLKPMDGTDFAVQLAQFSSLEQLSNLNTELKAQSVTQMTLGYAQSVSMIGKEVVVNSGDTTTTGTVTAVHFRSNQILATVNGCEIPLSDIIEIRNSDNT
jgi:flagellar basal-body rod modification protein FlgD